MLHEVRTYRYGISGGGIAGLAFAIALAKDNARLEVHIYESASAFSEVGAGIGLWPRGWDTLRVLGLEGDLRPRISAGTFLSPSRTFWKLTSPVQMLQYASTKEIRQALSNSARPRVSKDKTFYRVSSV